MTDEPGQPASPATPPDPVQPAGPATPPDPGRRRFFRLFAGDVVSSVGSVIGAAQLLQQESAQAARELLGEAPAGAAPSSSAGSPAGDAGREVPAAGAGYRAAFRWDGDVCFVVDQRRLPDVLVDLEVRGAGDGLAAIRERAIVGAPAQAQLAAITLALVAGKMLTQRPFARRATIRGAANTLRNARGGSALMAVAVGRMLAVEERLGIDVEPAELAAAMRAEAESIIAQSSVAHGALVGQVQAALEELAAADRDEPAAADRDEPAAADRDEPAAADRDGPAAADRPLRVLTIGSTGVMGGGQYGTVLSALVARHHSQLPVHVLVSETRPGLEGARIAAWELHEAGVPYAITTEAAGPGRVASGEVDVVLVGADRVCANGDVVATGGTYPLALAAHAAGVPVLVAVPAAAIDPDVPDGAAIHAEESGSGAVLELAGTRVAPAGSAVRVPAQDVTPAGLVTTIVTEHGQVQPPFSAQPELQAAG